VKELLLRSICGGILAQIIAKETKFVNVEEAFICSLFHSFGRSWWHSICLKILKR